MKIYSKEHEKALKLKYHMDEIEKEHRFHILHQKRREKQKGYRNNKSEEDKAFLRREKIFEEQEDLAYKQYYDHMHKHLNLSKGPTSFDKKKYPNGFVDEKFINDMFKFRTKTKKEKKKRSVK